MKTQGNNLDFNGQNIYVGIDVHKKNWSVAVLSDNAVLRKFCQDPSPEALYKFLVSNYPNASYHSVYKAGFSGFWTHERLTALGISNIVVNPADVPTMMKEKLRKTDAVDCTKLARGLRSGDLRGIYTPSTESLELRSLTRLRKTIVKDMSREKNRIKSFLFFYGIEYPQQYKKSTTHWSKRFMLWLRSIELTTSYGRQALDVYIEKAEYLRGMLLQQTRTFRALSRTELFAGQLKLITSIPGIGVTTGINLITEIGDIGRFQNAEQLAAYIGLIPMCHSSGEKENNGDITIRKHSSLRCSIIEAAWKAIAKDPAMTMEYGNYCKRMNGNKAIVKISRKLINRIFFVLKHQKEYVSCVVR